MKEIKNKIDDKLISMTNDKTNTMPRLLNNGQMSIPFSVCFVMREFKNFDSI